jgi:hypothetical protein
MTISTKFLPLKSLPPLELNNPSDDDTPSLPALPPRSEISEPYDDEPQFDEPDLTPVMTNPNAIESALGMNMYNVGMLFLAGATSAFVDKHLEKYPLLPQINERLKQLPILGVASQPIILGAIGVALTKFFPSNKHATTFGQSLIWSALSDTGRVVIGPYFEKMAKDLETSPATETLAPLPAPAQ